MFNIVPAIDLIGGKTVRLQKGNFNSVTEYGDPVEHALRFKDAGYSRLHLVDLDGARLGYSSQFSVLEQIVKNTGMTVDFSGGISSESLLQQAFDAGARQVCLGSRAVRNPALVCDWIAKRRPDQFIIAVDVKDGFVAVNGWKEDSSLTIAKAIEPFLSFNGLSLLCTDINKDGMLSGPAVALYEELVKSYRGQCSIIASGGVSKLADLYSLQKTGVVEVVVGKAFYEGLLPLSAVQEFIC